VDDGTLGDCGCGMEGMLVLDCMLVQPARTSAAPTSKPGITGRVFMTYPLERSPAPRSPPGYGCWRDMAVRCFRALAVSVALARELIPQETRRRTCGCGNAQGAPVSRAPDARAVRGDARGEGSTRKVYIHPAACFCQRGRPGAGPGREALFRQKAISRGSRRRWDAEAACMDESWYFFRACGNQPLRSGDE
jgi:hypothetical protein